MASNEKTKNRQGLEVSTETDLKIQYKLTPEMNQAFEQYIDFNLGRFFYEDLRVFDGDFNLLHFKEFLKFIHDTLTKAEPKRMATAGVIGALPWYGVTFERITNLIRNTTLPDSAKPLRVYDEQFAFGLEEVVKFLDRKVDQKTNCFTNGEHATKFFALLYKLTGYGLTYAGKSATLVTPAIGSFHLKETVFLCACIAILNHGFPNRTVYVRTFGFSKALEYFKDQYSRMYHVIKAGSPFFKLLDAGVIDNERDVNIAFKKHLLKSQPAFVVDAVPEESDDFKIELLEYTVTSLWVLDLHYLGSPLNIPIFCFGHEYRRPGDGNTIEQVCDKYGSFLDMFTIQEMLDPVGENYISSQNTNFIRLTLKNESDVYPSDFAKPKLFQFTPWRPVEGSTSIKRLIENAPPEFTIEYLKQQSQDPDYLEKIVEGASYVLRPNELLDSELNDSVAEETN